MTPSQHCADLVKHFEGLHDGDLRKIGLQPKRCPAGIWTEGYGHAIRDRQGNILSASASEFEAMKYSRIRTEAEASALLDQDLKKFGDRVLALVRVPMAQHQFDALTSFHYNTGALGRSTLLKKVNAKDPEGAEREFHRWVKATVNGKFISLPGLVARRRAEAWLFAGNDWKASLKTGSTLKR